MKKRLFIIIGAVLLACIIVGIIIGIVLNNNKKFSVTFNSDGGTKVAAVEVAKNDLVKEPKIPKKEGYTFDGWYLNDKIFDFKTKITKNINLKAKWSVIKGIKYNISFDSDGGTSIASYTIDSGGKIVIPEAPIKDGYFFVEWQLDGKAYDFNTPVTKDITLKAVYVLETEDLITYKVTFDSNGGTSVKTQKVVENKRAIKPANPTKTGYFFVEWQLNGKKYDFDSKVEKDITLKAVYKAKEKYTVTFDSNGGTSVGSQTIYEGDKVVTPTSPTKSNYTFKEWQLNGSKFNFNTIISGNITLKAVWEENAKCVVTWNSAGGNARANSIMYCGTTLGALANTPGTSVPHMTFDGWWSNSTKYTSSSVINSNITLTAKWIDEEEVLLNNAKAAIGSSYNITMGGQEINVSSTGCTITHSNPEVITNITRGLEDSNVSLNFNITCGSKTGTDTATGVIKASDLKYNAVANENQTNYNFEVYRGSTEITFGTVRNLNSSYLADYSSAYGYAAINNADIVGFPNFMIKGVAGFPNTTFIVTKR